MKVMKVIENNLCTPVVQYRKDGLTVLTIGAVHIGEDSYYSTLQNIIDQTPFGFYEKVQPLTDINNVPEEKRKYVEDMQNLKQIYIKVANSLGFISQHGVIYPNSWICADMNMEELLTLAPEDGLMKMTKDKLADIEELIKECPTEINSAFKGSMKYMAKIPGLSNFVFNIGAGPMYTQVFLKKRNEKLFEALEPKLDNPETDKIGVMYGSAHLIGINKYLKRKKFKEEGRIWLPAWDLNYKMPFLEAWGRISVFEKELKKRKELEKANENSSD